MAGILLLTLAAAAQLKIGDNTSLDANGMLSGGYNGVYGNLIPSDHSMTFGGAGTLSGYYYNPNFFSYTVNPFVNQSRDNSAYQSISNASGVNLNTSIFSGSHFPGAISYSKAYNSEGNYAVPGLANFTTHGNSDTLGINWSEILPGLPSLSANFQTGGSQYSIYGSNDNGSTDSRSFGLRSAYMLKGFNLNGYFSYGNSHSDIPEILQNSTQPETATSHNRGYGFAVGHVLPFHGGFSATYNSSYVDSDFAGYSYSGTIDTTTATASFQPTNKFHVSTSANYSDNLSGVLYQSIAAAGGVAIAPDLGQGSHSLDVQSTASYSVMENMQALATADHREQYFLGKDYTADSYGGALTYGRTLFGGNFNTAVSLTDNRISTSSLNTLGFSGAVSYNKRYEKWAYGASFSYAQNVQTLLVTYTSSFYSYSGNVRRRFGLFGVSAGASVSRTGLTEQAGTNSNSESFNTAISYSHWATLSGSYSKSDGNGILGGAGLVATPVPQPVLPSNDLILFGGKSYGASLSSNPMRKLTLSASFGKSDSNTNFGGIGTSTNTEMINALFQYQFRKMYLTGGYSRLDQGFSTSTTGPEKISAFYFGVSRWFKFF
jgi:hypothetical protein